MLVGPPASSQLRSRRTAIFPFAGIRPRYGRNLFHCAGMPALDLDVVLAKSEIIFVFTIRGEARRCCFVDLLVLEWTSSNWLFHLLRGQAEVLAKGARARFTCFSPFRATVAR